ncbi:hypothetical protein BS78_04G137600 [Paspalum vaginatum]|nr:hypothetical protein BS78_04G137600 [Paspalum vaginatum]
MYDMLFHAAYDGDLRLFKRLVRALDKGRGRLREAVEAARLGGVGALHVAAVAGSLEVCSYMVEGLRLGVDAVGDDGNCEMVELLLAKGAYVDPVAVGGTPLHVAAVEGKANAMKILLDHNADCNKTDMILGVTPLFVAINVGSTKCVKLLVDAGADVNEDCMLSTLSQPANGLDTSAESLNCLLEARGAGTNHKIPDHAKHVNKGKISHLKSLGSEAVERNDYHSASGLYTKAMDLDPDDATLFSNRSLCWLRMGDGHKALQDALECRRIRPDWPKACYRQGAALMLLNDYGRACQAFLDGFKLDPENAEIENELSASMEFFKISRGNKAK